MNPRGVLFFFVKQMLVEKKTDVMIMPLTKLSYTSKLHVIQIFPLQVGKTNISRRKGKGKPPTQSTKPVGVGDILVPLKLLIRWIIPSLKLTAKGPENGGKIICFFYVSVYFCSKNR